MKTTVYEKAKRLAESLGALSFLRNLIAVQVGQDIYPSFFHNDCFYIVVDDLFIDDMRRLRRKMLTLMGDGTQAKYEFLIPVELVSFIGTEFKTTIFNDGTPLVLREIKNYDGSPNVNRIKKYLADAGFNNLHITNKGPL